MAGLPPVAILAAGKGTRMSLDKKAGAFHKAVMPLGDTAIISHIIAKFPQGTRFVIAVGYLADQVKNYMAMMHPELDVTFVEVDNFDGPGSGPGYSLLCCRAELQEPFYMVPADTLFDVDPSALEHTRLGHNWAGVGIVGDDVTAHYTTFGEDGNGRATGIAHKERKPGWRAWNGLIYVHDHAPFWDALTDPTQLAGEHHVTNGIMGLLASPHGLYTQEMSWTDVGTYSLYRKEAARLVDFDFSKSDEALYFSKTHVVKMFVNPDITRDRVAKAALRPQAFPPIDGHMGQFYRYAFQPGETFYKAGTPPRFAELLEWCKMNLWQPVSVEPAKMSTLCKDFYHAKTMGRVKKYHEKYPQQVAYKTVNGMAVQPVESLLERLDWERLTAGVPVFMHGDLQFDNILVDSASGKFTLLDWRQDFAGVVEYGDFYYDLAKLYGGTILHYDLIKKNLLRYEEKDGHAWVDFAQRATTPEYQRILQEFVAAQGLDFGKVQVLTALIFLNMSPLHHAPFDELLYALSTYHFNMLASQPETASWFRAQAQAA